jgi:hypothetical protein
LADRLVQSLDDRLWRVLGQEDRLPGGYVERKTLFACGWHLRQRSNAVLVRSSPAPSRDFPLMRSPLKRGSRYATFRSFLRSAVRPAVNSYIRFGWIKRHTFCIAEDHWEQANLSARSLTPLAFATTLISHESFDIGSVIRQAPTQKDLVTLATEQCAPVLAKVRHGLTTSNRQPPKSSS